MKQLKIGIFFGGKSREREISFAGGRTVYDNLNKSLFEAVPIFVDSFGNFILLEWQYVYKGSIRDFYPPANSFSPSKYGFQMYADSFGKIGEQAQNDLINEVGKKINPAELPQIIDFAFLTLHGAYGEDGSIQGLLQFLGVPYTASGILPSAIGMDKSFQKYLMKGANFNIPEFYIIQRHKWISADSEAKKATFETVKNHVGLPFVTKSANQGSSIGAGVLWEDNFEEFERLVSQSFFLQRLEKSDWQAKNEEQKVYFVRELIDVRNGLGLPLLAHRTEKKEVIYRPDELFVYLTNYFENHEESLLLEATDKENEVLIEEFLHGKEFSCIVLRNEKHEAIALPPTEIRKGKEIYDYRSKYLAGLSSKITPIDLPTEQINAIRLECISLFNYLKFNTYARIDGFISAEGKIFLNDPNTTSGMLPSSFFFHQAAEIGMNPSQFLTYIIRNSLQERINTLTNSFYFEKTLKHLDKQLENLKKQETQKTKIGVILGGYSSERHISVESGRNIYEKLSSSNKYLPIPIFLTGDAENYELYEIPINILLKDNADDIKEKIMRFEKHEIVEQIKAEASDIIEKYCTDEATSEPQLLNFELLQQKIDAVFIALHGRPGEDGRLQKDLEKYHIPYNGSGIASSQITIDKYATNQLLKKNGIKVAEQYLLQKTDWQASETTVIEKIERDFGYPLIAKPSDDGCSSAVKKLKNRGELSAYMALIFRKNTEVLAPDLVKALGLKPKEEFPAKQYFLIEELIEKGECEHFLEVTGGLLTHFSSENNSLNYEMFEPSETLAGEDVLSLEEKFLAGQGQNITPARYAVDAKKRQEIAQKVMAGLKKVAEILNIEGYARIDAFVKIYDEGKVETYIIEVNSLPGMTPATCIFHQTALNGYTPYAFIDKILEFGKQRLENQGVTV